MAVEFPYLITNRISAPLELGGEESLEWQGSTEWPKKYTERSKKKTHTCKKVCKKKREQCWTMSYLLITLFFCRSKKKHFIFLPWQKKSNSFSWNWQVFVSGQLTIFSLPVMKVVAGVNALGGNGGLFIPLKAQRHTCFAWSVICNCGISWEAREQSTLCFEWAPCARLKMCEAKSKKYSPTHLSSCPPCFL